MMSCALAACALPRSTEGPVHTYVLASDEPALESGLPTAASGIRGVLVVGLPQAAAGFDTPRMAYVQRSHEVNYYATSQWADSPARMVVPLLIRSMDRTGLWRAVVAMPTTIRGDYRLDVSGLLLQQEFLQPPSRVRVWLRAQLVEMTEQHLLGARSFEAVESTPSEDAYGGVLAANRAVGTVLHAMESWITSCLRGSTGMGC
jgi:cholesterol transport system auxiliary component